MFRSGDLIGAYFLIEKVGRGTFGEVWLAEEKTAISKHKVALKLPNEEDIDTEAIRQEADVWEKVKGHPNILPIIKADVIDGQMYIASEYAPDGSLKKWLKAHNEKAPTIESALKMIDGILAGLEHLHSKGVIHRDLKPDNILLQAETPRIADFGIARLIKANSSSTSSAGTPSYMAPECFHGIRSVQSDIWAVGIIFHLLLTGKLPFPQSDQISVMNAILNSQPEIQNYIPSNLHTIINKTLQKDPTQRYRTAQEMQKDLNLSHAISNENELPFRPAIVFSLESEREEETVIKPSLPNKNQTVKSGHFKFSKAMGVSLISALFLLTVSIFTMFQVWKSGKETNASIPDLTNANIKSNSNSTTISAESEVSSNKII